MGFKEWKRQKAIMHEGRTARNKLIRARKKGILPKGSMNLYRAMKKAGLDI